MPEAKGVLVVWVRSPGHVGKASLQALSPICIGNQVQWAQDREGIYMSHAFVSSTCLDNFGRLQLQML